jgi:hypothetical protein
MIDDTEKPVDEAGATDLRAALTAAFEAQSAEPAAPGEAPADELQPSDAASSKARDEKGRFAPKTDDAGKTPPEGAKPENEMTAEARQDVKPGPETVAGYPATWPADLKDMWSGADPRLREQIAKRETEAARKIQEQGAALARFKPVEQVFSAHRPTLERYGVSEAEAAQLLLEANDRLERDPVGALVELAQRYGVDLAKLAGGQAQPVPQAASRAQAAVPDMEARREMARIKAELDGFKVSRAAQEIESFSKSAEHFADVQDTMTRLIQSGQARGLQDAYDQAIYLVPEVREKIVAAKIAAEREAEKQRQAEAVKKAKAASVSAKGAPATGALGAGPPNTVKEALMRAFDAHQV